MEHRVFVFDKEDRSTIFFLSTSDVDSSFTSFTAEGIKTEIEELSIQKMR